MPFIAGFNQCVLECDEHFDPDIITLKSCTTDVTPYVCNHVSAVLGVKHLCAFLVYF